MCYLQRHFKNQFSTCLVWESCTHIVYTSVDYPQLLKWKLLLLGKPSSIFPEFDTKNLLKYALFNCKGRFENTVLPCLLVTLLPHIWFSVSSASTLFPLCLAYHCSYLPSKSPTTARTACVIMWHFHLTQ